MVPSLILSCNSRVFATSFTIFLQFLSYAERNPTNRGPNLTRNKIHYIFKEWGEKRVTAKIHIFLLPFSEKQNLLKINPNLVYMFLYCLWNCCTMICERFPLRNRFTYTGKIFSTTYRPKMLYSEKQQKIFMWIFASTWSIFNRN